MEGFVSFQFEDMSPQAVDAVVAIAIAIGTLYCFLGYRTLKFLVGLTGFLLAGATAGIIAAWISHGQQIVVAACAALGGAAGALAFFFLYKVGIFSLGLLAAAICAHNVFVGEGEWAPWASVGVGVAGGILALLIERPVMMTATAVIGAWLMVSGVVHFLLGTQVFNLESSDFNETNFYTAMVASWVVLSLSGLFAQIATRKRNRT